MVNFLKKSWWMLLVVVAVVAGVGVFIAKQVSPQTVLAHQLKREDVQVTLTITGEVKADHTASITAPFQATIQNILVEDGDLIQAGQPLVLLDSDEVAASVAQASAQEQQALANLSFLRQGSRPEEIDRLKASVTEADDQIAAAKAQWVQAQRFAQRMKPLYADGAISRNEYDQALTSARNAKASFSAAQARKTQAEESLKKAQTWPTPPEIAEAEAALKAARQSVGISAARLGDRTLKSPLSGVVLARLQEPGDVAQPGQAILKVANPNTLEVVGYVEEADLHRVTVGNPCHVILDARPETALPGIVRHIGSEVNPANGTLEIKVTLDPSNAQVQKSPLVSGMTADISIVTNRLKDALVIPSTAALKEGDTFSVFRLAGGGVQKVPVILRRLSLELFEVIDGLESGDWIARSASDDLLEKGRVEPLDAATQAKAKAQKGLSPASKGDFLHP